MAKMTPSEALDAIDRARELLAAVPADDLGVSPQLSAADYYLLEALMILWQIKEKEARNGKNQSNRKGA